MEGLDPARPQPRLGQTISRVTTQCRHQDYPIGQRVSLHTREKERERAVVPIQKKHYIDYSISY